MQGGKAHTNDGWMWALGIAAPTLLLVLFSWHIVYKSTQEGREAQAGGRVVNLPIPAGTAKIEPSPAPISPSVAPLSMPVIPPPGGDLKLAPAEALTENTPLGPLPRIAADGSKAWLYYGRPFTHSGDGPMIAVVVTGLGLAKQSTELALRLPPDVSLSFSPYAQDAPVWAGAARAAGHEVLVDIPFEPKEYPQIDPGPYGLLSGQAEDINEQNLRWILTRFSGYVGGLAPGSEHFTSHQEAARPILQFLAGHGLMLELGASSLPEQASQMLKRTGLPFLHADSRIGADMTQDEITTQLLAAERMARAHGQALIVVDAAPMALKELAGWSELIGQKGIILIPVSALARLKFS